MVERTHSREENYQLVGGTLVDKETGEKMFMKLLPQDEDWGS